MAVSRSSLNCLWSRCFCIILTHTIYLTLAFGPNRLEIDRNNAQRISHGIHLQSNTLTFENSGDVTMTLNITEHRTELTTQPHKPNGREMFIPYLLAIEVLKLRGHP